MVHFVELFVYQGANFACNITLTDASTNTNMNIASTVFSGRMKKSYISANVKATFGCTAFDPANGVLQLILSSDVTANIAQGRYVYRVNMINGTQKDPVVEGLVFVLPDV